MMDQYARAIALALLGTAGVSVVLGQLAEYIAVFKPCRSDDRKL